MRIKFVLLIILMCCASVSCRDAQSAGDDEGTDPKGQDGTGSPNGTGDDGTGGTGDETVVGTGDVVNPNLQPEEGDTDSGSPVNNPTDNTVDTPVDNPVTYPEETPTNTPVDTGSKVVGTDSVDVDWETDDDNVTNPGKPDYPNMVDTDVGSDRPTDVSSDTGPDTGSVNNSTDDTGDTGDTGDIPEDCYEEYRSADDYYCEIALSCERSWIHIGCYDEDEWEEDGDGDGGLYCYCYDEMAMMEQQYSISGMDMRDACGALVEVCASGEEPDTLSEVECTPNYESARDESCSLQYECSQDVAFGDDVVGELNAYRYVDCYNEDEGNDGDWYCYCNTENNNMELNFEGEVDDTRELCQEMMSVCDSADTLNMTTDIVCEVSSQSARDEWCDTSIQCYQVAEIAGQEVEIAGWTYSYCDREDDGEPWQCECGGGHEVTEYVMEGDVPWDTCTAAAEKCMQIVIEDGEIGGGGGRYYGDDIFF